MNKAIFWDRDGTINEARVIDGIPYPPNTESDTHIIPGIRDVMAMTSKLGYLNIVITNQPDFARGTQTKEEIENINNYLLKELPIDDLFVCFHDSGDKCLCRKPKIGLFLEAQKKYDIDFSKSWAIGDRWSDIEAGYECGCSTILIGKNYKERQTFHNDFEIKYIKEIMEIIYAN